MRYSFAAILALASSVLAQTAGFNVISKPGNFEDVPAGSTYTVVWDPTPKYSGKTVTISLIGGKDQKSLLPIGTLGTAKVDDGKFDWKVADNLGDKAIYGVVITLDEDKTTFQYSFPFHIAGSGSGSGWSSGTWSTSTTASANSTATPTSGSTWASSTPIGNLSTTATSKWTTVSSMTSTTAGTTKTTASSPSSSTAAAPSNVGSTLALFGGLAMAVFAL